MEVGGPKAAHREQLLSSAPGSAGCEPHSGPCLGQCGRCCCCEARCPCGLFDDHVLDVSDDAHGGDHDPDDSRSVIEIRFRIDKEVGEVILVAIIVTPPDESAVADISVVVINEFCARHIFDPGAERLFYIVVPAKFLDHLPGLESEFN